MNESVTPPLSERRRRSRTIAWAIGAVWAWQATLALVAAWPAASLVRAAFAGDPQGDALVWRAGAHAFLAFLVRDLDGAHAAIDAAALVLIAGAVAGLVPMAALLIVLGSRSRERRGLGALVGRSLHFFPALATLLVMFGAAQAAAIGAAVFVSRSVARVAVDRLGEAPAEQLGTAVGLLFVAAAAGLAVLHDLARAAVVHRRTGPMRSLGAGISALQREPGSLAGSWGWRMAASFVSVFVAAQVASRIGGDGGIALILLALVHQAVALLRVALRASWLAAALRSIRFFQ